MALLHVLSAILLGVCQFARASYDSFENDNVLQTVDLTEPYLSQTFALQATNIGDSAADTYVFLIPFVKHESLALIEAHDQKDNLLEVVRSETIALPDYVVYEVKLAAPIEPQQRAEVLVAVVYSQPPRPLPAQAKQSDPQFLLFEGSRVYESVYRTRSQKTRFNTITGKAEILANDGSKESPEMDSTRFITLEPLENVAALTSVPLAMRYESPLAIPHIQNLDRTLWVSHWGGSLSFDESYDVQNVGTAVQSSFSRLEFTNLRAGLTLNTAAIRGLRLALPESHREEYYVDLVGNVSTSTVNSGSLDVIPRYPIMGGWFYNFTVGWATDLGKHVRQLGSNSYILAVPLIGGPDKVGYFKVTNRIVLPEGAQVIDVISEIPFSEYKESLTYSYLDLYGRQTLELGYSNLVSDMAPTQIFVSYNYTMFSALRKPVSYAVLIFTAVFTLRLFSSR